MRVDVTWPQWMTRLHCWARYRHRMEFWFQLSPSGPKSERCLCGKQWGRTWHADGTPYVYDWE